MTRIRLFVASLFIAAGGFCAFAQDVALKTNILYDISATPNLGIEFGLAPKWTLDASGQFNFWDVGGRKWKHWLVQPEVRRWFCESFAGHFIGVHVLGGQCNVGNIKNGISFLGTDFSKLSDRRYQGWFAGAGLAYGYSWILGRHWNLEAELGAGYIYTRYDVFPCTECGNVAASGSHHNYFGPTKAALNLVFVF